jgi:hypothetical protein
MPKNPLAHRVTLLLLLYLGSLLAAGVVYRLWRGPRQGRIEYALSWNIGSAKRLVVMGRDHQPSNQWQIKNDLGYTITLQSGFISTVGLQLLACDHRHYPWDSVLDWFLAGQALVDSLLDSLVEPLFGTALAGHGGDTRNPAALGLRVVESLPSATPQPQVVGQVLVHEPAYCQGHLLVAGSARLAGQSLRLSGSYQRANANKTSFQITSHLATGAIHPITNRSGGLVYGKPLGSGLRVVFERQLDRLFDGIDFANSQIDGIDFANSQIDGIDFANGQIDGIDFAKQDQGGQAEMLLRNLSNTSRIYLADLADGARYGR